MADELRPGISPTFFLSGFECSTFLWKEQGRRDLVAETRHREHVQEDYQLLRNVGIAVAREGISWPLVEKRGYYNFSSLDPVLDAMNRTQILPIWDLCHYGYPIDADPFDSDFAARFARYCRATAEYVIPRVHLPGPHYFTPINEITFFAFMGGRRGWVAPWRADEESRVALRRALCRAAIADARAIRAVDPAARMVSIDPLVNVVAPGTGRTSRWRPAARPTRTPMSPGISWPGSSTRRTAAPPRSSTSSGATATRSGRWSTAPTGATPPCPPATSGSCRCAICWPSRGCATGGR